LPEEQRAAMLTQVPLGRLGQAQEIADAVVFLASGAGAYITGETVHVNGGMLMD
jgi:3-oxoacyl-[acyl-carrier protein] reductase